MNDFTRALGLVLAIANVAVCVYMYGRYRGTAYLVCAALALINAAIWIAIFFGALYGTEKR